MVRMKIKYLLKSMSSASLIFLLKRKKLTERRPRLHRWMRGVSPQRRVHTSQHKRQQRDVRSPQRERDEGSGAHEKDKLHAGRAYPQFNLFAGMQKIPLNTAIYSPFPSFVMWDYPSDLQ